MSGSNDKYSSSRNQFIKNDLKQEIFKIAQNNLNMYKRLLDCKKSNYNKEKFLKEYKQSQSYKRFACKYPSIDFYKTLKQSNYFSSLKYPSKEGLQIINSNYLIKPKKHNKKKNEYQSLFFLKEINKLENKQNKLLLDQLNINSIRQKNIDENFNTHYALRNFYKEKNANKDFIIESINNKEIVKYNRTINNHEIYNKKLEHNLMSKTNYKENRKKNMNDFCLEKKTIKQK